MAPPRPHRTIIEQRRIASSLDARGMYLKFLEICKAYNVTTEDVLSGSRRPRAVRARDAFIHRLLQIPMSTVEVGLTLDMDHTSIIAARDRYIKRDNGRLLT